MSARKELDELLAEQDESATVLDGFDGAIVGLTEDFRVVYDMRVIMEGVLVDTGGDVDSAIEHYYFNVAGTAGQMADGPILMIPLGADDAPAGKDG